MSYTRYNFLNWNNLPAEDVNAMQANVKQVVRDFLANILNIGFGQGGWKNIGFAANGTTNVTVQYKPWATIVQDHMIATPDQGEVVLAGFEATVSGERQDLIAARVYEFEDRTKIPYTIYQQVELRRVEAASPNAFGLVAIGNNLYQVLAKVICDTTGIKEIQPFINEPRIDTRNVDGTELKNGQRESLYEALLRLGQQDGGESPSAPVDLSPYVKKNAFAMLTGAISYQKAITSTGGRLEWSLEGLYPRKSAGIILCEINQIVQVNGVNRRIYRPHKDWLPASYVEVWEHVTKDQAPDTTQPAEKVVFVQNGANPRNASLYVRVFLVNEEGIGVMTAGSSLPSNYKHTSDN